jgi:NAD(P)-dependent dehydrogenase (short-subunit alcohol dehydrogenase family)
MATGSKTVRDAADVERGMFDVSGKAVLITGGAQGLGRMIANGFSAAGAKVIITSRDRNILDEATAELRKTGVCHPIAADLATTEGSTALSKEVLASFEHIDVLINNAGRTWGQPLEQFSDKGWSSVFPINVQVPFTLIRDLLPLLRAAASDQCPARVINIGSIVGKVHEPLNAYSYAASKAAIHHLSRILAAELAPDRITVNSVVPGYFPTNMTSHMRDDGEYEVLLPRIPLGRVGCAADAAGTCIFLASAAGAYITGSEIVIDGGLVGCR